MGLTSLCEKMILVRLKKRITFALMYFVTKKRLVSPKYISDQKFENSMGLLFVTDSDKSHYVYIK